MQVLDVFVRGCGVALGIDFRFTTQEAFKIPFEYEWLCPASGAPSR